MNCQCLVSFSSSVKGDVHTNIWKQEIKSVYIDSQTWRRPHMPGGLVGTVNKKTYPTGTLVHKGTEVPKHRVLGGWYPEELKCWSTEYWNYDTLSDYGVISLTTGTYISSGTKVPNHRLMERWSPQGLKWWNTDDWDENTTSDKTP